MNVSPILLPILIILSLAGCEIEAEHPYLVAERSDKLLRSFFIPWVSEHYCEFGSYVLLRNKIDKRTR